MGTFRPLGFVEIDAEFLASVAGYPPHIRDIGLRLAWAGILSRAVSRWEFEFVSGGDLTDTLTADPENDPPCYVIRENALAEPPPEIGLLAADCIHSLRACLDYLARQLVIACGKEPNDGRGRRTSFPIQDQVSGNADLPQVSPGINRAMRQALDSVQPYQRGPDFAEHPLFVLRELSNVDKHRLLNTAVINAGYTITGLTLANREMIPLNITRGWGRRTRPREVARVPVRRADQPATVQSGSRFGFVGWAALPEGALDLSVGSTLRTIYEYTFEEVLPTFLPFLDGHRGDGDGSASD